MSTTAIKPLENYKCLKLDCRMDIIKKLQTIVLEGVAGKRPSCTVAECKPVQNNAGVQKTK